jgi:hypothetical protein
MPFPCLDCDCALCPDVMGCVEWSNPLSLDPTQGLGVVYQGDDVLGKDYKPSDQFSDDELSEQAQSDDAVMRDLAKKQIARRKREQAETDEARKRLYSPEAQQAREQSDKLP